MILSPKKEQTLSLNIMHIGKIAIFSFSNGRDGVFSSHVILFVYQLVSAMYYFYWLNLIG